MIAKHIRPANSPSGSIQILSTSAESPSSSVQFLSTPPSPWYTSLSEPKQEDWPHIPYWTRESWLRIKHRLVPSPCADVPTSVLYLVGEDGKLVSRGIQDALRADVQGFWVDQLRNPETACELAPCGKIGLRMRKSFHEAIEGRYPWLRLCEGHWKVEQLWHDGWTSFTRTRDIPSTAGKKRPKTEEEEVDIPSKRLKGKEVDREPVPAPQVRPKAQKTTAKAAKVSIPSLWSASHTY